MRKIIGILGAAAMAAALMSCETAAEGGGEACGQARFEMTPDAGAMYTIEDRQVCFHSKQQVGGCWIWNYRIPPRTDFEDYIDIHYDQSAECETNNVDGAFDMPDARYQLTTGTSPGEPPEGPRGTKALMASGTYSAGDEQGEYELFW